VSSQKSNISKLLIPASLMLAVLAVVYVMWSYGFTSYLGDEQLLPPGMMLTYAHTLIGKQKAMFWLCLVGPIIFVLALIIPALIKRRMLYGDARFGSFSELKSAGLLASVGIVHGRFRGRYVISDNGHTMVCAPPGGGKSTSIGVPTALQWPGSMLAMDVKGELYDLTAGYRAKTGQAVFRFAPLSVESHCYNPFAHLVDDHTLIDEVDRVANFLIPTEKAGDPWTPEARALFTGIALHEFTTKGRVSIGDIYLWCRDGEATWDKAARLVKDGEVVQPDAIRLIGDFGSKPPKEASGVKSTLTGALSLWQNPLVRAATERSDFDFRAMRKIPTSIYICIRASDLFRIEKLLSLIYQQLISAMSAEMPRKDEPHWVLMLLDELAAAGRMDLVKKGLAFLRGFHVRVLGIIQSPAQLDEIYTLDGRRAIFDTCAQREFFQPNDLRTAEDISKELGTFTASSKSRTRNKGSISRATGEAKQPLMFPDQVQRLGLPNALLFREGARPFLIKKSPYYDDPLMLARTAILPPPVPSLPLSKINAPATPITDESRIERDEQMLVDAQLAVIQAIADQNRLSGNTTLAHRLEGEVHDLLALMQAQEAA
jgi:type IV secretion system protein VirD4